METLKERLMVKIEDAERQKQDWHRAEIVAAVRKRGKTIYCTINRIRVKREYIKKRVAI